MHSPLKARRSARGSSGPPVSSANSHPPPGPSSQISDANRSATCARRCARSSAVRLAGRVRTRPACCRLDRPHNQAAAGALEALSSSLCFGPAHSAAIARVLAGMLPAEALELAPDRDRSLPREVQVRPLEPQHFTLAGPGTAASVQRGALRVPCAASRSWHICSTVYGSISGSPPLACPQASPGSERASPGWPPRSALPSGSDGNEVSKQPCPRRPWTRRGALRVLGEDRQGGRGRWRRRCGVGRRGNRRAYDGAPIRAPPSC